MDTAHVHPEKAGNRVAIAEWSRERNVEAMVWIDLNKVPVNVRAGTSVERDRITIPDKLRKRFDSADEDLEIWHNHPKAGGVSTAVPGGHDVATAMRAGVAEVWTVDDKARRIVVRMGKKATKNRAALRAWINRATATERWILDQEAGDETDPESAAYRHIGAVETAIAAADAAGLIETEGLSETATRRGPYLARKMEQDGVTIESLAVGMPQEPEDSATLKKGQGPGRAWRRMNDGRES